MTDAAIPTIETDRLLLREWRETDLEPFAALNADPRVAEFLPHALHVLAGWAMMLRVKGEENLAVG